MLNDLISSTKMWHPPCTFTTQHCLCLSVSACMYCCYYFSTALPMVSTMMGKGVMGIVKGLNKKQGNIPIILNQYMGKGQLSEPPVWRYSSLVKLPAGSEGNFPHLRPKTIKAVYFGCHSPGSSPSSRTPNTAALQDSSLRVRNGIRSCCAAEACSEVAESGIYRSRVPRTRRVVTGGEDAPAGRRTRPLPPFSVLCPSEPTASHIQLLFYCNTALPSRMLPATRAEPLVQCPRGFSPAAHKCGKARHIAFRTHPCSLRASEGDTLFFAFQDGTRSPAYLPLLPTGPSAARAAWKGLQPLGGAEPPPSAAFAVPSPAEARRYTKGPAVTRQRPPSRPRPAAPQSPEARALRAEVGPSP